MPRYFFHLRFDDGRQEDEFGVDLADVDAARAEALNTVASVLRDAALTGDDLPGQELEVADERGTRLFTFTLPRDEARPRRSPDPGGPGHASPRERGRS